MAGVGPARRASRYNSAPASRNQTVTSEPEEPSPQLSFLRTAIRNFSSSWFLIPQGVGISSVVLFQFEERFEGLDVISYIFWAFTTASFISMILIYAVRVFMFPRHVGHQLMTNAAELSCIASASIAFTSINQMLSLVNPGGDPRWASVTVVLWWFNVSIAVGSMLFIPFSYARMQHPSLGVSQLSPSTQLPMVAAITLASGGGVVAVGAGQVSSVQTPIIFVSYLSLALAMPLVMVFTTIYMARLLDGSMPPRPKVYQDMILAGPWGQASFALQVLGRALVNNATGIAQHIAGELVTESSIRILGYSSMFLGFLSWGQGTFWWAFAIMSCVQSHAEAWSNRKRRWVAGSENEGGETYTLAGWALLFPWGTYTNSAIQLGKILGSPAFRVFSIILTVCLVIFALVNMAFTVRGVWNGSLLATKPKPKRSGEGKMPATYL